MRDADLSAADLSGANLSGANLTGATLAEANLDGARLERAVLHGAVAQFASFVGADLEAANLTEATLTGADLTGARLVNASLGGSNLVQANLTFSDLSGANVRDAILSGAEFNNAELKGVNLYAAKLLGSPKLEGAHLENVLAAVESASRPAAPDPDRILVHVFRQPGVSASTLARRLGTSPAAMNGALRELVVRGDIFERGRITMANTAGEQQEVAGSELGYFPNPDAVEIPSQALEAAAEALRRGATLST